MRFKWSILYLLLWNTQQVSKHTPLLELSHEYKQWEILTKLTKNKDLKQGVKLCLIQAPMWLNFSLWQAKSWKLVSKLVTRMLLHNLTSRYCELKQFAKINPWQTSSLSLCPKRSTHTSQSITRRNLCFRWAWTLYIIYPSVHFVAC